MQQLIFDFTALENILIDLPDIGNIVKKHIKKEMKKLHSQRLKFISIPILDTLVSDYISIVADHQVDDFEKLLEVKALGRNEIKTATELYRKDSRARKETKPASKEQEQSIRQILGFSNIDFTSATSVGKLFSFPFQRRE